MVFVARLLATATVLVIVTRLAERAGPYLASVLITLPLFAAPSFYFLMHEVPAGFIAEAASYAFGGTGAVLAFTAAYIRAARRFSLPGCLACGAAGWLTLALPMRLLPLDLGVALIWCLCGVLVVRLAAIPVDVHGAAVSVRAGWPLLLARATVAGAATASVSLLGALLGPQTTGLLVSYPITLTVSAWLLHLQFGGAFAAATLAATQRTLVSYSSYCLALALLAPHLAIEHAFWLALGISALTALGMVVVGAVARRRRLRQS